MRETEGNHNINNGLAKVQHLDKAQLGSHHSLWQSCGTSWSWDQAAEWPWLCSFLFHTSQSLGTWGVPCAGSSGLSPLWIEPCLLCCWLWLFSGDAQWDQIYVTAKLECWFPCLGITASWCDGLRAHRALKLHYPEGEQVSVILNGRCFCQNRFAINLGKWINIEICVHFYLNSYAAANAAKNLLAVPQIPGVLGDRAFRNPAAGFLSEDWRNGWFWNGGNAIPILSSFNSEKHLLARRWQKIRKETAPADNADTAHCADRGLCWECSWVPCASPRGALVSPPGSWSWLALTEITIVVDFMNRVSEVLKARRVSRGYLGWTAWMPHAHWYGVPSLSCMLVCFLALGAIFWCPQIAACHRNTWQFLPYLSPYSFPLIAAVRPRPFPPFWFPAAVSSTLWHEKK